MIIGNIDNWDKERIYAHPALRELIDFLRRTPRSEWEDGKHPIQGEEAYCSVVEIDLKDKSETKAEKHEIYGDIHYLLEGNETFGWAAETGSTIASEVHEDKDYSLYDGLEGEQFYDLVPGMYAVVFPQDIHRPGLKSTLDDGTGKARKIVLKFNARVLFG